MSLVWQRTDNGISHSSKSYATLSPVTTGIGDHLSLAALPSLYSYRRTQPGRPSLGWCNEYQSWFRPLLGTKWRVLRSSGPCDQDCWHAGWSRLKTLDVNWAGHPDHMVSVAACFGLTLASSEVLAIDSIAYAYIFCVTAFFWNIL